MYSSLSFLTISAEWRASSASKLASRAAISCSCCFINVSTSPPSLMTYNEVDKIKSEFVARKKTVCGRHQYMFQSLVRLLTYDKSKMVADFMIIGPQRLVSR